MFSAEIKLLNLTTKRIVNIEVLSEEVPVVVRWHPRRDMLAAIGYQSGRVTFVELTNMQSCTIGLLQEDDIGEMEEISEIVDMAWDQGEDHLLVAY